MHGSPKISLFMIIRARRWPLESTWGQLVCVFTKTVLYVLRAYKMLRDFTRQVPYPVSSSRYFNICNFGDKYFCNQSTYVQFEAVVLAYRYLCAVAWRIRGSITYRGHEILWQNLTYKSSIRIFNLSLIVCNRSLRILHFEGFGMCPSWNWLD